MSGDVAITSGEGILAITLNRPEAGNAITPGMATRIAAAVRAVAGDVRVIRLTAAGADFCTGRASVMPPPGSRMTAGDLRALVSDPVLDFYAALREAPVPLIAAVQGQAAGVGCALAVLADVAVAADTARFVVPEMNHDIAPTLVMDALCDRLPRAAFARMVLTRDPVDAAEAKAMGVIGAVVPEAALAAETDRIVAQLAANAATTVRAVKAFLTRAPEASQAARRELAALLNSAAAAERYR